MASRPVGKFFVTAQFGIAKIFAMTTLPNDTVVFSAELRPNRSSTRSAVKWLAIAAACIMVPVAFAFTLAGAWPVFGFMGLELVALVALLHYNHRRSAMVERIAVTEKQLVLERVNHWGRRESWTFPRHWARIKLIGAETRNSRLEFRSHGHAVTFGSFLTTEERAEVASALRRFLASVCAPARPQSI